MAMAMEKGESNVAWALTGTILANDCGYVGSEVKMNIVANLNS
jgi:hypothetical protein